MKPVMLALAFVLCGSVAWGNPLAEGAPVTDQQLAAVKGTSPPILIDVPRPPPLWMWIRWQSNTSCNCLSPSLPH